MVAKLFGRTEPRLWTRPLRELTEATSLGFEVIAFAAEVLGVSLYPWQRWLLIHALELLPNGEYRFKRIVVLVARQQGKTTLAAVLAAWWLFIDSKRYPERVPPLKFKIVGVAQNLDIAKEPWAQVKTWCDPEPETEEESELAIPMLQDATAKVRDANGTIGIIARSRAHYEIRAAKNARGKPAAKVLMDEGREQRDHVAWNAVSQTTKSFFNGQLWLISNAGDASAVVLNQQRDAALEDLVAWLEYVEAGIQSAEDYANGHDVSLGLFEWSAPDGCAKDDVEAILQANPSIGYGAMTVQSALADIRGMTDAGYRTEVLCQRVTAKVDNFIDVNDFTARYRPVAEVFASIEKGSRTVWGIDTSADRSTTWLAASVFLRDRRRFSTIRHRGPGQMWVVPHLVELAEESGFWEVAVQGTGCPAMDLIKPLRDAGFTVHALDGTTTALATGRYKDRVRDGDIVLVDQSDVRIGIEGGVVRTLAENKVWNREGSMPVDIAGVMAETVSLYALEDLQPEERKPAPPPPPAARLITHDHTGISAENLADIRF